MKHSLQINCFSPEWVLMCVLRLPDWLNDLEHSLQINGCSPEWVLMCVLRWPDAEKDLGHCIQGNVFALILLILLSLGV